jgi:uncharacterized integral membrane protein
MRILLWLIRALLFFVLFAFALNNQHEGVMKGFFGFEWRAPMVVLVLVSFATGATLALVAVAPRLWRRQPAPDPKPVVASADPVARPAPEPPDTVAAPLEHPPRDGV